MSERSTYGASSRGPRSQSRGRGQQAHRGRYDQNEQSSYSYHSGRGGGGRGRYQGSQSYDERRGSENREQIPRRHFNNRPQTGRGSMTHASGPISLETNHFELCLDLKTAFHYDVTITPTANKKLFKSAMQEFIRQNYAEHYPAFDGTKNLYSSSPLLVDGQEITRKVKVCNDNQKENEYKIKIKLASTIDLTCLNRSQQTSNKGGGIEKALQCLDIVLRNAPSQSHLNFGKFFFTKPDTLCDLRNGLTLYNGFVQSVIFGEKLFLNVDTKHWPFVKDIRLIDLIDEFRGNVYRLNEFIDGIKIRYELPNNPSSKRVMTCSRFTKSPREEIFKFGNKSLCVEQYYKELKKVSLKYPNYPCVRIKSQNTILYPPEFCTILEGQVNKKLNSIQNSLMINATAAKPYERKNKILQFRGLADYDNDKYAKKFGITISKNFVKIEGNVLKRPILNKEKFQLGAKINTWGIICIDKCMDSNLFYKKAQTFEDEVIKQGGFLGMQIAKPQPSKYFSLGSNQKEHIMKIINFYKNYDLVVVVISKEDNSYQYVKQVAEITVGVVTQCLKSSNLEKLQSSLVKNLLLKINSKLNGINHTINLEQSKIPEDCIFMGADVTHPNRLIMDKFPSIAAVTASCGPDGFRYKAVIRLQEPTVEIISKLDEMTFELLKFYTEKTGKKPKHIIFFRDGVSDGDFGNVVKKEVNAIYKAFNKLDAKSNYKPKVTFMVVQKRHHTRFFPTNDKGEVTGNAPPGTVVDKVITTANQTDYYLLSHTSMRGVARPTRYRKLYDDISMNDEDLKNITNLLCHMYSRCITPVSYPAPTYNAHLAADRARSYLQDKLVDIKNLDQSLVKITPKISNEYVMYYV